MDETPARPDRKPPRFPYVGVLLCAACLGAAGWLWMRYSYAWEFSSSGFHGSVHGKPDDWPDGALVRLSGPFGGLDMSKGEMHRPGRHRDYVAVSYPYPVVVYDHDEEMYMVYVSSEDVPLDLRRQGNAIEVTGRAVRCAWWLDGRVFDPPRKGTYSIRFYVDTTATRWHPGSIAGLMVGAMGLFVLTLALGHWLRERRADG